MVQIIKDILGITVNDFDFILVMFSCFWVTVGLFYIFALLTVPVNMITNAFERSFKK